MLWDYQVDSERLELTVKKVVDLEDWSWRNKLRIDGIREKENKTWDKYEQENQSLVKYKLGIAENVVQNKPTKKRKKGTVKIQENPEH